MMFPFKQCQSRQDTKRQVVMTISRFFIMLPLVAAVVMTLPALALGQTRALAALATATLEALQPRSIAERREYCGYLGRTPGGQWVATPATKGDLSSCLADEPPADLELFASYHSHGNYDPDHDSEVPSSDDMLGDREEGVDGFISTPGGRLWFIDSDRRIATQVCSIGCLTQDPRFRQETDPDWTVPPSLTLQDLFDRE